MVAILLGNRDFLAKASGQPAARSVGRLQAGLWEDFDPVAEGFRVI
jgi:hypothetical protein